MLRLREDFLPIWRKMYKKLFTTLLNIPLVQILNIVIYQMDQDQYSNGTRPSTNHRSQDHQQQQTNTSEHNPLLSEGRVSEPNQIQNEVEAISPHQPQSQRINSHNRGIEQREINANQVPVVHSNTIKEQIVANEQNQRQPKQYYHSVQISQPHSSSSLQHKNEQDLLNNDYKEEDYGTSNLNTNNVQNCNQNILVYREINVIVIDSQAQTDLLDFGPTIQEQIHNQKHQDIQQNKPFQQSQEFQQNKEFEIVVQKEPQRLQDKESTPLEIQNEHKKDIPMDIESESKGYLTEKESLKSDHFYHQRQTEWEKHQQRSNTSQKQDIQQTHFYEQTMPQNNSNLFKFGFTIYSKKKNQSDMKTPSPRIYRQEYSKPEQNNKEIELVLESEVQNQSIQKDKKDQQSPQNHHMNDIPKDSSIKSQKSQKNSEIKPIQQQIQLQNNNQSSKKSNTQKQQKKEEIVIYHQIKDDLPSQVPVDQFQPISNNSINQQAPQIEFQSISAISFNQKQNQSKPYEVQAIEENDNNNSQKENNHFHSFQNVLKELKRIHRNKSQQRDQHNFLLLQNLVQTHINLITLKPIDHIGQHILENGQHTMMFIDLFVLNSPIGEDRKLFHKYLVSSLSHHVNENKQIYQKYKQRFWPRKSEKFTITDCYNLKNSPTKQERHQQEHEINQKYSVQVHDASVHDRSVQQGPRSIMKSNNKRIREPRTEMPVPRNPGNIQRSGLSNQNQKETRSLQKIKKGKQTKKRVTMKKQKTPEKQEKLGYAETFVTVEDRNGNQVLKTRKVSLRLLQKSNKQKSQSKQIKNSRSRPKKKNNHVEQQHRPKNQQENRQRSPKASAKKKVTIRKSARLTDNQKNQQQILTADYIKSHFQELKINSENLKTLPSGILLTEEDRQIAKMLEQYKKILQQQERLALDLQMSHQMPPIQQPSQQQIVQDTDNPVSMQRIRQIKQELQINKLKKYKIMQQITQKHIVIETIIDPDINQHGIYALVKVSKMTSVLCGARYFLIPMSKLQLCSRDKIDEDIKTIKSLVQESEKDNIGLLKPSSKIQEAIEAQKNKRARQSKKK